MLISAEWQQLKSKHPELRGAFETIEKHCSDLAGAETKHQRASIITSLQKKLAALPASMPDVDIQGELSVELFATQLAGEMARQAL